MKDGLSGITVYCIAQDRDGFLWFGTETGLSRFDGSHFKNYTSIDGLDDNEIINLFVDSKNRVWIFPFKNSVYYYYHGKIHNTSNDSLLKKFYLQNEIFKACEDKEGNIFFLASNKIFIFSNEKITEINKIDKKSFLTHGGGRVANGNCIFSLTFTNETQTTSYEYINSKFAFHEVKQDTNLSRFSVEINANFGLTRNLDFFEIANYNTKEQIKIKVPENFHNISYINDSSLIISSTEKTLLFNLNQKKVIDSFLSTITVNRCFKDNEDNLWFATVAHGLYRLSSTKFKIYTPKGDYNTMPVYSLKMIDSKLYIGSTKLSLWRLDLRSNTLKKIKIYNDYKIGRVSVISQLKKDNILLGTDNGIFKINNSQVSNYFKRTSVKSLFSHNNSVLAATDRYVFDLSFYNFEKNIDTIWQGRATCACKIDNQYYIGTLSGLYIIKNSPNHTITNLGEIYPVLQKRIVAMVTASDGSLWIATENNGIICMKKDKIKYQITAKNRLISNYCRCLCISKNNLWVGSDKGVSKVNLSNPFYITNYTAAEGLDCEIINCIYAKGDSVFAGTPLGVTFFEADKIQTKSICELKLIDIQSRNDNWYYKQDSINLKRNDNSLRFEYAGISFVSSGDITYYYQLKGLDSTWQSTKQNSVEFQSLPSGNYEFKIYAINRYGIKSKMITIPFSKEKTFWQLFWVRGMLIAIMAFTIWLIFMTRMKIVKRKADEKISRERKIYELEQMALRSQMNPHFIFNSLNSLQQYVFAGDAVEANHFITSFSSLVRQTLYISGKKFISLDEEIKYLESYLTLEQAKYERIFKFQIIVGENVPENILMPPLLLQPFIENSIRHGVLNLKKDCGRILIQFWVENNFLLCLLEDNGIGRERAMKLKNIGIDNHRSKGMELVQKRIENLNSIYNVNIAVSVEDVIEKDKTGTRVKIQLPLNYDNH